MSVIWSRDIEEAQAMSRWVSGRISDEGVRTRLEASAQMAMGVVRDDVLVACFVYSGFNPEHNIIEISGAGEKGWMTKEVLFLIYAYPFNQLGCQLVIQRNDPADHKLNRQLSRYGFKGHLIPRLRGRDKGELIMTLTEEDWRSNGYHKENEHG